MANAAIKRALLSVTNKDGICEFATRLVHDCLLYTSDAADDIALV